MAAVLVSVAGAGCGGEGPTGAQRVARVVVEPDSAQLPVGGSLRFSATALDSENNVVRVGDPSWFSSDTSVVTVGADGEATGVSRGRASVLAALSAARGTASVDVTESSGGDPSGPLPGQVVVDSDDAAWFRYADGGPFFMCGPGDPEGFLYRGDRQPDGTRDGDQMRLIEKLGATGANSIYVMAVRSHGGDGDASQNPFVGNDPARGLSDAVLDQWESWFTALEERGVVVFFIFYDDSAEVWETGDDVRAPERSFLRGIVDRFEHHTNIVWAVAEEYQEAYSRERVSRIAHVIRQADDHRHPIAVHQLPGLDFDFADDPSVDQFAAQVNFGDGVDSFHDALSAAFSRADGRYNLTMAEGQPDHGAGPAAETRELNWAAATAGAYVMVLRWTIADTPRAELEQCGHMVGLMERTPLSRLEPHDELALGGTRWVLADPGSAYVLYADSARTSVGLRNSGGGVYDITFMDAVTGRVVERRDVRLDSGDVRLTVPGDVGEELAVYLRRSGS